MNWINSFAICMVLIQPAHAVWWPFSEDKEKIPMNVYFYYPQGEEVYLGRVTGISHCQNIATEFAINKRSEQSNWDYLCCTIKRGSACYEKLR